MRLETSTGVVEYQTNPLGWDRYCYRTTICEECGEWGQYDLLRHTDGCKGKLIPLIGNRVIRAIVLHAFKVGSDDRRHDLPMSKDEALKLIPDAIRAMEREIRLDLLVEWRKEARRESASTWQQPVAEDLVRKIDRIGPGSAKLPWPKAFEGRRA